ncbi:putative sortase-sorted surface anchored protein (pseudogene) [Streptococcus pseudopneumoniae]|nr:putative sortase-sorted surface anchored protein (pseudogene) [Streptococcus pseudopneumoniae]
MNSPEKQLKYSIRKVSVGAASVVIGALYLLMGAGIAHAEGVESAREAERTANPTDPGQSGIGEPENKTDLSHTDAAANTYNAPVADNPLVTPESTKPRTRSKRELADGESSDSSNGATGTESEPTSGNEGGSDTADTDSDLLDANRKGDTVKEHQPGVIVPKDGETGGDDKNAHLKFDTPKENLTLEQLWDIVKNMPDDFQNNERSYLRSMNTLGDALRFKNGKVSEDGTGDKLQDGEIRELDSFGGWTAIAGKDGRPGKFVIGKKNADGYFTGWYKKEDGTIEQGGMLGADALDNIFVHEQALDRRFKYMLMLVKGRTRANRDETVSDNSKYDPRAQNERANKNSTEFKNLPFLEKDKYNKYSPGVVGYNGIEKQFTAFSPGFGSRVRVEFVTGYISDINGSKGTYRVVIKTKDTAGQEKTVYDETIHRIAEIVQNEDLYKKGLNVELANKVIKNFFDTELKYRRNRIFNTKKNSTSLRGKKRRDYTEEDKKLEDELRAQALEEAKKQGDIVLNVDQDLMSISKSNKSGSEWKKTFTVWNTSRLSNELNNLLKEADKETPNTPTWLNSSKDSQARADDRAYRLLTTLIPGAKKITYHVNDDQLEVETENYTYTAARNGSKEVGIQGSDIAATLSADEYNANRQTFESANTNTKANDHNNGWARAGSEEFKHFSHFVGVDKGIVRTKVLTDKELSEKIKDAVGPGNSNLGKGGYFSTGDVLLGKDVVSYTVQVFSENNERVGVNPQSHRVQYNLPILADFSVIQDTVEPSRTVVEKIIPKLNIPEEEKKKITEKIKEKKKTSELADLISGNVKVRYVDEQGRLLSLKNDTGIGEKESAGTYITNKKQLIGTSYDVTDKKLSSMTTTDGTYYTFKELAANSESLTGNIVSEGRTVTLVYKESEAPTTATVTANYYKEGTQEKLAESVVKADLAIGSQYTTEAKTIEGKTTTEDKEDRVITRKTTYTLVATPANATGTVPEDGATVNYYYRENVEETVVPKTEDVQERKTVTRTIKYVDKANETKEVADSVTQTVELTRTNKRNKVTGKVTAGDWSTGTWGSQDSPTVTNYDAPDKATVAEATVTSTTTDTTEVVKYPQATEDVKETKTVTRTIKYVDATDETTEVGSPVTQTVELTRTNKRNKVTKVVTEGEWTTGNWDEVVSPEIENYGKPDLPKVSNAEVTADSKGTTILVRYDRLSRPEKPIPEIPSPQEPGAPGEPTPDKPNPQPNPEHPSVPTPNPELPNQETPIPELTPEPGTPKTEIPVSPDPEVPTSETNKREELPNTGTEANATLASAGIMTLLAGLGLGFFKKKEDEK